MIRVSGQMKKEGGTVSLPASKSISNRLLILNYLSSGKVRAENLSGASDTLLLKEILSEIESRKAKGRMDLFTVNTHDAGTVMRFIAPVLACLPGDHILHGTSRMHQRPVGGLVNTLRQLGASIEYLGKDGYPPLRIRGGRLNGGDVSIDASISSQFVSALLLISPFLHGPLTLNMAGIAASRPYIQMTVSLLQSSGADIVFNGNVLKVNPSHLKDCSFQVEADWSAAAFWYGMVGMAEGASLRLKGLQASGLQGDQAASVFFSYLGVESLPDKDGMLLVNTGHTRSELEFDFIDHPDLALPMIVCCAAKGMKGLFSGLYNLKHKESDRMRALQVELPKTGAGLKRTGKGCWELQPGHPAGHKLIIDHHGDHRVAMSFAMLAEAGYEVIMDDPDTVNKSYPGFWDEMRRAGYNAVYF